MTVAWKIREPDVPVPSGWRIARVGDLVQLTNGYPFPSDSFGTDGDIPLVRIRDLVSDVFESFVTDPVPQTSIIRNGDVIVGMDGDFNLVMWSRGRAALNQRLCALRPLPGVDIRFIAYALPASLKIINDLTFSTTVKHLSSSDVLSERIPLPPLDEQRRIADFLDAETSRIDRLAELRNRQEFLTVERLEQFVSKLFETSRSAAPTRVKHLLRVRPRYGVLVPEFVPHGVKFIRVNDLLDLEGRGPDLLRIPKSLASQYCRTTVEESDLLVSVVGTLGRAAVAGKSVVGANVNRAIAVLRTLPEVAPELLRAWIEGQHFQRQAIEATASDSAQRTLGMEDLSNFGLRWPTNPTEQSRMLAEMRSAESTTKKMLRHLNRQLDLLSERRQALITAAVTGQIDVTTARPGVQT